MVCLLRCLGFWEFGILFCFLIVYLLVAISVFYGFGLCLRCFVVLVISVRFID